MLPEHTSAACALAAEKANALAPRAAAASVFILAVMVPLRRFSRQGPNPGTAKSVSQAEIRSKRLLRTQHGDGRKVPPATSRSDPPARPPSHPAVRWLANV